MADSTPHRDIWHPGERAIQEQLGVAGRMEEVGKHVVRNYMPDQHRGFFAALPFLIVGTVDGPGDSWATVLTGKPGFLYSPSPTVLAIDARCAADDPAGSGLTDGRPIGLLGIELHSRRRNRMNGVANVLGDGIQRVTVDQSFGNCPQYIQLRDFEFVRDPGAPFSGTSEMMESLDDEAACLISRADTFFVSSYAETDNGRQVDVSHRGGKAGFVRIGTDGTLTIPDFAGNLFFATLGNILRNRQAGMLFIDFETGELLQMTGTADVILDSPEIGAFQGAERLWTFRPRKVVRRKNALTLRWKFRPDGWSPNALMTGDWTIAAERQRASALANSWRPFRIARIEEESISIRSFYLEPMDGAGLSPHLAGQHLPIRLAVGEEARPAVRTYTLSAAPSDGIYRITVKRDGVVSRHLHDNVQVGDKIDVYGPSGDFIIDARGTRPAVLLGAGVGITPMLAMLRHIVYEGLRTRSIRPTTLFHAARSKLERPFDGELNSLVAQAGGSLRVIRVLSEIGGAEDGVDYDAVGRIDIALLIRTLGFNDYDFYLCGPPAFTQGLYDGLRGLNIADERIHAEAFGPSSLIRSQPCGKTGPTRPAPSTEPVPVAFIASMKEASWNPQDGSLLDLAEARGLTPAYGCRAGSCGSCRTRLLEGRVTYLEEPTAKHDSDEVLICCAVPAAPDGAAKNHIQLDL